MVGHAIEQHAQPILSGAELPQAVDHSMCVAHGGDVRIRHEIDRVGGEHRDVGARTGDQAGVDDDVVVAAAQRLEQLFEVGGVLRAGPVGLLAAGEDVEARLVLDDELAQKLGVDAMEVVERVDEREARPHAEEQRHLADELMQVDDERRLLRHARDLDRAVDRDGRRAGAALDAEERQARVLLRDPSFGVRSLGAPCGMAALNDSSSGQARYSFAPARIACRICSGCADEAIAKIVAVGHDARRRSMASTALRAVADVDDRQRRRIGRGVPLVDQRDRCPGRAKTFRDMRTKLGVGGGDENRQLCHGLRRYSTRMIAYGKRTGWRRAPLPVSSRRWA